MFLRFERPGRRNGLRETYTDGRWTARMARTSLPSNGAEHLGEITVFLKLADKYVREGKYAAALDRVTVARARDPHNPYAIAYEERIRSLIAASQAARSASPNAADPPTTPTEAHPPLRIVGLRPTETLLPETESVRRPGPLEPPASDLLIPTVRDPKTNAILKRARQHVEHGEYERAFAELARASLRDPHNNGIIVAQLKIQWILEDRKAVAGEDPSQQEDEDLRRRENFLHAQASSTFHRSRGDADLPVSGLRGSAPSPRDLAEDERLKEQQALAEAETVRLRRENAELRARLEEERQRAEADRQRLAEEDRRRQEQEAANRAEIERLKEETRQRRLQDTEQRERQEKERLAREAEAARRRQEEEERLTEAQRLKKEQDAFQARQDDIRRRELVARLARETEERRSREDEQRRAEEERQRKETEFVRWREEEAVRQEQIARLKRELEEKRRRDEEEMREERRAQIVRGLERAKQLYARGGFDEALEALSFGMAVEPENAALRELAGLIRDAQERDRQTRIDRERKSFVADAGPAEEVGRTIRSLMDEADTLSAQQRFKEALRAIARAYAIAPTDPEVRSCELRVVAAMEEMRREQEEVRKQRERELELKKEEEFRQLVEDQRQRTLREMIGSGIKKKGRARPGTRPYRSPGNGS